MQSPEDGHCKLRRFFDFLKHWSAALESCLSFRSDDLPADLDRLRGEFGVQLAATVLDADSEPLEVATRPARFALVFGSEGHGLERSLVERCDRRLTIRMQCGVDSLNVAVAAGIFLHHFSGSRSGFPA